jgi:hypothetical protein
MKQPNLLRRRRVTMLAATILMALPVISPMIGIAQKQNYSWMELPKKDAERMLTNSPWSQTQVDTDVSEQFYSPTRPGTSAVAQPNAPRGSVSSQQSINNNRSDRGALNEAVSIKYQICFLSSRPVRQAIAKMVMSSQAEPSDQLLKNLQDFVERDFSPYIAIAVTMSSDDGRFSGPAMQAINSATTGTLKNKAFLERQDGKRLFIQEYRAPHQDNDNLGAKFIFPRVVDGEPFLNSNTGTVRFYAEFNDSFKLNMRYKVADMIYDQKLEY